MTDKKEPLTQQEFDTLISLCMRVVWSDSSYRKKIQEHEINVVPANFYSEIPLIDDINGSFEYRKNTGGNLYNKDNLFDEDVIREFIGCLDKYAEEFDPPLKGDKENPEEYFWGNPAFSFSDAMSYYCVVRHYKPDHIVEVGAGFSTFIADQALRKNGKGKLTLIEPNPRNFLRELETVQTIIESKIQDLPRQEVIQLIEDCDIWFIDSTHTVKIGSDCLFIYLLIMPEIKKDIIVHTHDIYLPFGVDKDRALDIHGYWTEQYLLYAYMMDNPKIKMLFGSRYAKHFLGDEMEKLMRGRYPFKGGSIWYELNGTIGI